MKMFFMNLIRLSVPMLLTLLMLPGLHAQQNPIRDNNVSIRYEGLQEEYLVFAVQVENAGKERYNFAIYDRNRNVLFSELFQQDRLEKKFLVPRAGMEEVVFEISGKKYQYRRQFTINSRFIEEVTVAEESR